jgi:prepilin-type N-terminal cleavage/methylation domain-containing protein
MSWFGATNHRAQRMPGFTLVELLVATAIALSLMLFTATVFSVFGQAVEESQDVLRLHDQMRSAAWSLRQDLSGITCPVKPWGAPEADAGYFELIEGPLNDYQVPNDILTNAVPRESLDGKNILVTDIDDVLMFTTQRPSGNFVGTISGTPIESSVAEVAWFCVQSTDSIDGQPIYNLHRRRLLARSYIGTTTSLAGGYDAVPGSLPLSYQTTDVSLRPANTPNQLLPNGLSDLTKRENRFFHRTVSPTFPFGLSQVGLETQQANSTLASGEDVILNNVIAFDVRVFDPEQTPVPAYVDLGGSEAGGLFPATTLCREPNAKSMLAAPFTYCTWSEHYEANGIDEDEGGMGFVDEGANGKDDSSPSDGVADDPSELETSPPYNVPLRAIEVRIRCIEPKSKQIRQITIRHSFPH